MSLSTETVGPGEIKVIGGPRKEEYEQIIAFISAGQFNEADELCRSLSQRYPKTELLHRLKGSANLGLGNAEEAITQYQIAIGLRPENSKTRCDLALAFYTNGNFHDAIREYRLAIDLSPADSTIMRKLGIALMEINNFQDATEVFSSARELDPTNDNILTKLGEAHFHLGNYEDSIEAFTTATNLRPDVAIGYANLATALYFYGETNSAIAAYQMAIALDPLDNETAKKLGQVFFNTRDYACAAKMLGQFDDQESVAKTLESFYHLGELKEFDETLNKACQKDTQNVRVAAISAFASQQRGIADPYPFCPNAMDMVVVGNIFDGCDEKPLVTQELLEELERETLGALAKGKGDSVGSQTTGNLFNQPKPQAAKLEAIIRAKIKNYREIHHERDNCFIKAWPEKTELYGSFVKLAKGGFLDSHIHPSSWLCGVVYLDTIEQPQMNEGSIEFRLQGYEYPVKEEHPNKIHQPAPGDIVLFPSSLFHRTFPILQDKYRRSVTFDLCPATESPKVASLFDQGLIKNAGEL